MTAHSGDHGFVGLVADLGGTNARFALVDSGGRVRMQRAYRAADFASAELVLAHYLQDAHQPATPAAAVLAIAGQVTDGRGRFSNLAWAVDAARLRKMFGFQALEVINDFVAQALAVPRLCPHDLQVVGPSLPRKPGVAAVLGAGTGLGVAALILSPTGEIPLASEAGHASFAPDDDFEVHLWRRLRGRYGRVSNERLLSGSGLVAIYEALCETGGRTPAATGAAQVVAAARTDDAEAAQALERFVRIYGRVAGDLALTFGASGGVFISGGIAPKILDWLDQGGFRAAFEDKGRLASYLRCVPTFVVTHPSPGLIGAARRLILLLEQKAHDLRHARPSAPDPGLAEADRDRSAPVGLVSPR